jgi:hypothetical protein
VPPRASAAPAGSRYPRRAERDTPAKAPILSLLSLFARPPPQALVKKKLTSTRQRVRPHGYHLDGSAIMTTEMLSYSQLGERLKCSPEAARALVKRLRLPRQTANDGKVLVSVDVSEINHKPMPARSPGGDRPITATLKARVEALQTEMAKVEASAAGHRADFERERERADRLMAELLRATADTMAAKEVAARLGGELSALRSRPWWRRMVG